MDPSQAKCDASCRQVQIPMSPTNESPYWSGLQASLVVQVDIQNLELTHHHDLLVDKASFINFTIPLHTMTAAIVPVVSVLGR